MVRDLMREDREGYTATAVPRLVTVPGGRFLSIEGAGDPNGEVFADRLGLLYPIAYGIRAQHKERGAPFKVPCLEGLWWLEGDEAPDLAALQDRARWRWRLLLRMPPETSAEELQQARDAVRRKKGRQDADEVTLFDLQEGRVAQVLHTGPYAAELPTIEALHAFIGEVGVVPTGRHHEIYLSDSRRTAPERLRTILRQPVCS